MNFCSQIIVKNLTSIFKENINLGVYDSSGRLLQSHMAPIGKHQFELNLPAGAYFVKPSGNSHHETLKIIIQ